jgi:peptidase M48-like protein
MKHKLLLLIAIGILSLGAAALLAEQAQQTADQILDKIMQNENQMPKRLENFHPLVETYIQNLDRHDELAFIPKSDEYFLGKLDLANEGKEKQKSLLNEPGFFGSLKRSVTQVYSVRYLPGGFAQTLFIKGGLDRQNYNFEFIRREFLGEVRCVVFDVKPKLRTNGIFNGRIWAEDVGYNIVRFNGAYAPNGSEKLAFHFDSWREHMGPNLWFPSFVYTEESDLGYMFGRKKLTFKAQTRLWGYNVGRTSQQNELTSLVVESDQVHDSDETQVASPVAALRQWERQAEDNIIQRLEKASLIAPDGEVNKVLETVLTNLEITNNLNIEPEVRARVLLTSPLESFTIGNTIVLSRGLVDVLPDEASLAMILAHELAHIALGHQINTKYSFNDRMLFQDQDAIKSVQLKRDEREETEADTKAAEYLKKSPYSAKLGSAGLFLKAVNERASVLNHLLLPHIGNTMAKDSKVTRMASLIPNSPELQTTRVEQIAALPLGSRVHVDPWSAKIELVKSKPVALQFAREKMPFEVTPVFLFLSRQGSSQKAAQK